MENSLINLYNQLTTKNIPSSDGVVFIALKIPGQSNRHIGKDVNDQPAILISTENYKTYPANILMENLRVEHGVKIKIYESNNNYLEGIYSIIQCTSNDFELKQYFLRVMDSIILSLPPSVSSYEVSIIVDRLSHLFLALKHPPQKSIHGLWSELFIISNAIDNICLLQSWHNDPYEVYDFSNDQSKLEVKSSSNRTRCHHFTYQQVYPPENVNVVIASLFIEESSSGLSLLDLWSRVKEIAGDKFDLRAKVDRICTESLGLDYQKGIFKCFEINEAKSSLIFYNLNDIPKVPQEIPPGVSEVKFKSDLSFSKNLNKSRATHSNAIYNAYHGI